MTESTDRWHIFFFWVNYSFNVNTFTFMHYSAFRLYIFCQYVCSLGIEPTTFCAANAMLYTGTLIKQQNTE